MKAEIESITLELAEPLVSSAGTVDERDLLLVCLEGEHGLVGWGEAAPLEPYDGVTIDRCRTALELQTAALRAAPKSATGAELLELARSADDLPQAMAAIDTALWDLAGQRDGVPLAELLSRDPSRKVPVNGVIGAETPVIAAQLASDLVAAGFTTLKVKVGTDDDIERLEAVRVAVGPRIALRIDANGAWSLAEARARLAAMEPFGIEIAEEPVSGVDALRELAQSTSTPIAADETSGLIGALAAAPTQYVCLKLGRAGGISALLAQAALVRSSGGEVYVASMLDGPVGIAAAVHAAAALRITTPCGLATLDRFDGVDGGLLAPTGGEITVPLGAGLGVGPAEA
ncbi:MAG: hypothetical protein F2813_04680 [Actinobacteria bacterium]|uniref:Unannotated protein n=1 Tax=freshwater metagenome TaxID=449393 RepID=A0A6J5ZYP4_9ZZZZ|nr:hypothetical protein [Actinomycetota bacterium]